MAGSFDIMRPLGVTCQDCLNYADRKQNIRDTSRFFVQRPLHLVGYPIAGYRMFREYHQQLVKQTDSFVNAWADFVPNFQVFWCKPAANSVVLQIGVQACDKGFVVAGVADKAGIVFNWLAGNRFHVVEKRIGNSAATNERFGDMDRSSQQLESSVELVRSGFLRADASERSFWPFPQKT